MALKDAIATVVNRNQFYRDGYRLMLRVSVLQGVVIVLLTAVLVFMLVSVETRYIYFATTSDGRIINIVPLNEEFRTRAEVVTWAARTVQNTLRLSYHDYRQRLQDSSGAFTPAGWESFTKAMSIGRYFEALEARKLVMSLSIGAAPEIKSTFVKDGVFTWFVQMPITIQFEGGDAPAPVRALLLLQIVRVSTLQAPDGIAIAQWVAKPT